MFVVAEWCKTYRSVIYGNKKDELNQHIHREGIWETSLEKNHAKDLRNKGKQHTSVHIHRKPLLGLTHLPTEQIEI